MRTYQANRIHSQPDWDTIAVAPIDMHLWSNVRAIIPRAQLAWDKDALYIRLQTVEPNIRREYTGDFDPVWQDSCLEFFFCPENNSCRYFNFECNPNGSLFVGFGNPNGDRCRLHRQDWKQLLQLTPFDISGGWGIEMRIPVSFIQLFVPDFTLYSGLCLRANFYKCGDLTEQAHYIVWNPIDESCRSFHSPQFFGELQLM